MLDSKTSLNKENLTIDIEGEIVGGMCKEFFNYFSYLESAGSPNITIRINSEGGNSRTCLHMCNILKQYKGKITGIVKVKAYSSAAILLQYCDHRIIHETDFFSVHHFDRTITVSYLDIIDDNKSKMDLFDPRGEVRELDEILSRKLIRNFKGTKKEFLTLMKKSELLSGNMALELGFVDEVIEL